MWKPIIVVWNKNYARKLKKDRSSGILMYQISEEEKKTKKQKKKLCDIYQFPGCEYPLWKTTSYQKSHH